MILFGKLDYRGNVMDGHHTPIFKLMLPIIRKDIRHCSSVHTQLTSKHVVVIIAIVRIYIIFTNYYRK